MIKQKLCRKIVGTILLVSTLLLAYLLYLCTPTTNAESCNTAAAIATDYSIKEDFSEYTDNELPESINADNVLQVVPAELFNKNETYIYCGSKYGFIIHSEGNTNYILVFLIDISSKSSTETYSHRLSIYYEGAFTYSTTSGVESVHSDKHLMLSDISFNETIIDASCNNILSPYYNQNTNDGAIFISCWQGDTQSTYYDTENLQELAGDLGQSLVISAFNILLPGVGDVFNVILEVSSVIEAAENVWQKTISKETIEQYPASAQAQLSSETTGYRLMKTVSFGNREKIVDVLSYQSNNSSEKGDYVEFCTRTVNPNDIAFYLATMFNFNVGLYSTYGYGNELGEFTVSGAYSTEKSTTEYTQMTVTASKEFNLNEKPFFAPLLKGESFTFTPDITGEYSLHAPNGYVCKLRDPSNVAIEPSSDGNYFLTAGQTYSVGICTDDDDVDWNKVSRNDYYSSGEFIGETAAFVSVQIKRVQDLPFIDDSTALGNVQNGVSYVQVLNNSNNDLLKITSENIDSLQVFIIDKNFNILSSGSNCGSDIVINYPYDEPYYLTVINNGSATDISITDLGELVAGQDSYVCTNNDGLFYAVDVKYTQTYYIDGTFTNLYNEKMQAIDSVDNSYYLTIGRYYIKTYNGTYLHVDIIDSEKKSISLPNTTYVANTSINAAFKLLSSFNGSISLSSPCDIYNNGTLIAENTTSISVRSAEIYDLIRITNGNDLSFIPDSEEISFNQQKTVNNASAFEMYKFTLYDNIRIYAETLNSLNYEIYDSSLKQLTEDHGYMLSAGTYYIVVQDTGNYSFTIKEKLIPVSVSFTSDNQSFTDTTGQTYYYGKSFTFPVPNKEHYDFNGWQGDDGTMITDAQGKSFALLLADSLHVTATWTVRKVSLQINMAEGSALWWDGVTLSSVEISIDYQAALFDELVNLYDKYISNPSGNKIGHYFTTFSTEKVNSQKNTDYYEFSPIWIKETYDLRFILPSGGEKTVSGIHYDDVITSSVFTYDVLSPVKKGYSFVNWKLDNTRFFIFREGERVGDFTPNYGSSNADLFTFTATLSPVTYTVKINGKTETATCESGYKIKTLSSYGISTTPYYGKNIYYIRSDNGKAYYENELASEIYSDITFTLKSDFCNVALSYTDCEESNNVSQAKLDGSYTLAKAFKRGWEFTYWTCGNTTVTNITASALNITSYKSTAGSTLYSANLKANFKRDEIIAGISTYIISSTSSSSVFVDCSKKLISSSLTLRIDANVKEVTFYDNDRSWNDFSIYVESRTSSNPLTINFDGITSIRSYANDAAINATSCPNLTIHAITPISIKSGEINSLTNNYDKGAILCRNLTLEGNTINISGNSYILSYAGTSHSTISSSGIYNINTSDQLIINGATVSVYGGNGRNGINFGGVTASSGTSESENGTNGANGGWGISGSCAIEWHGEILVKSGSLYAQGGNGGDGGSGGHGGNGAPGVDGSFFVATVAPGNGGNGGDGGNGGNGAIAIRGTANISGHVIQVNGTAGNGGVGGKGGQAGTRAKYYWSSGYATANPGASGKNGSNGIVV